MGRYKVRYSAKMFRGGYADDFAACAERVAELYERKLLIGFFRYGGSRMPFSYQSPSGSLNFRYEVDS